MSYVEEDCLVGGFCFVGHFLHCIKTKPEPSLSFVSYFFGICNCCSFGFVEFMTDRAYADCWTCII